MASNLQCLQQPIVLLDESIAEIHEIQSVSDNESEKICSSPDPNVTPVKIECVDFEVERPTTRRISTHPTRKTSRMSVSRKTKMKRHFSDDCILRIQPIKMNECHISSPSSKKVCTSISSSVDNAENISPLIAQETIIDEDKITSDDINPSIPITPESIPEVYVDVEDVTSSAVSKTAAVKQVISNEKNPEKLFQNCNIVESISTEMTNDLSCNKSMSGIANDNDCTTLLYTDVESKSYESGIPNDDIKITYSTVNSVQNHDSNSSLNNLVDGKTLDEFVSNNSKVLSDVKMKTCDNFNNVERFLLDISSTEIPIDQTSVAENINASTCSIPTIPDERIHHVDSSNLIGNNKFIESNTDPVLVKKFNLKVVRVVLQDIYKSTFKVHEKPKLSKPNPKVPRKSLSPLLYKSNQEESSTVVSPIPANEIDISEVARSKNNMSPTNRQKYSNTSVSKNTSISIDIGIPTHPRDTLRMKTSQITSQATPPTLIETLPITESPTTHILTRENVSYPDITNDKQYCTVHPSVRMKHIKLCADKNFPKPSPKRRKTSNSGAYSETTGSKSDSGSMEIKFTEPVTDGDTEKCPIDLTEGSKNARTELTPMIYDNKKEEPDIVSVISRRPSSPITKASRILLLKSPIKSTSRSLLSQSLSGNSLTLSRHFCVDISDSDTFCSVYTSDDNESVSRQNIIHIPSDTETENEAKLPVEEEEEKSPEQIKVKDETFFSPTSTSNVVQLPVQETPSLPTFIRADEITRNRRQRSAVRSISSRQLRKLSENYNLKKAKVTVVNITQENMKNLIKVCQIKTNWTDKETLLKAGMSNYDAVRLGLKTKRKLSGNTRYGFREMVYKKKNLFQGSPKKKIRKKHSPGSRELDFLKTQRRKLKEMKNAQRKEEAEKRELESIRRSLLKINRRFFNQNRFWSSLN